MTNQPLSCVKLTNNPDASSWAQIYEYKPEFDEDKVKKGYLYCLLAFRKKSPTDNFFAGSENADHFQEILETASKQYFASQQNAFEAFEHFVSKLQKAISSDEFEFASSAYVGSRVYLSAFGGGSVFICRDGVVVPLIKAQQKGSVLSGTIKQTDTFMLTTKSFLLDTPMGLIQSALCSSTLEQITETLIPYIRGNDSHADSAAAIIRLEHHASSLQLTHKVSHLRPSFPARFSIALPEKLRASLLSFTDVILKRLPERRLRVASVDTDVKSSRRKRITAAAGGILLVLLILSIGIGLRRKEHVAVQQQYEAKLTQARTELEEARGLKDLSRDRARAILLNARSSVIELKKAGFTNPDLDLVANSIEDSLGEIAGLYKLDPELFLDLSLVSSGLTTSSVAASGDRILLLDRPGKKLVSIGIATKKTEVVSGPSELPDVTDVTVYADRDFILTANGVSEIIDTPQTAIQKDWGDDALLFAFASNLYVLDKQGGTILRYPAAGGNAFAAKQQWLASDMASAFADVTDWVIDGSIWMLHENSKVTKWSLGRQDYFALSGVSGNFVDMFTDEAVSDLYFLDKQQSKVVVTDKKGIFKAEYETPVAAEAEYIIVSQSNKKLLFVSASKIFFVELKHL